MPLEVGPGYVSPTSGGFTAPGATAPAPAAPTAPAVTLPRDVYLPGTPAVPTAPVLAPAVPVTTTPATGGTVQAKSFFSNLWDQFVGPLFKSIASFFSGLFGGAAGSASTAAASIPAR